jgi:prepilin-type processing-associated H-X9-DG protein
MLSKYLTPTAAVDWRHPDKPIAALSQVSGIAFADGSVVID